MAKAKADTSGVERARAWVESEIAALSFRPASNVSGRIGRMRRHLDRLEEIGPSYVATIEAEMPPELRGASVASEPA